MGLDHIFEQWKRARSYIGQAEELYTHLKTTETSPEGPQAAQVLLPLAYKRFIEANSEHHYVDDNLLTVLGQYLGKKYPGLEGYFTSERCKESIKNGKDLLDEFLKEQAEKERTTAKTRPADQTTK